MPQELEEQPHSGEWRVPCSWRMRRFDMSTMELLMEELEEITNKEVNVDKIYWNKKMVEAQTAHEKNTKLRALVREEGCKTLLLSQRVKPCRIYSLRMKRRVHLVPMMVYISLTHCGACTCIEHSRQLQSHGKGESETAQEWCYQILQVQNWS